MTVDRRVTERLILPSMLEALDLVDAGRASPDSVDRACREAGHRTGPFERLALDGPAIWLRAAGDARDAARGAPRFEPPSGLAAMALGAAIPEIAARGSALDDRDIAVRLDLATINEAYRMVGEGLGDPVTLDAVLVDKGWPAGAFGRAGQLGLRQVVERLHDLAGEPDPATRDQFLVAPALWLVATV